MGVRGTFHLALLPLSWDEPKPPALERKQLYLEHLEQADADTLLVSLADKLHNARTLLLDFRTEGPGVFERFKLSREETLWYYGELAKVYSRRKPGALADELRRVVTDLRREAATTQPSDPNSERFVSKPGAVHPPGSGSPGSASR
jgi:(p)ppGpp synthase/HD superfamily hydrolase